MNEYIAPEARFLKDKSGLISVGDIEFLRKLSDGKSGSVFFCGHIGSSMNPTLCEMDLLEIVPYGDKPIRAGDVVIFACPGGDQFIIHRVISITSDGIRTCGDNNSVIDPWLLQSVDVFGKLIAAQRGQKRRKIIGGSAGRLLFYLIYTRRWLKRNILQLLKPIYYYLVRHGTVRRLLPFRLKPRIIIPKNGYPRLLLGRRIVGKYDARLCQWYIQHPFRLFVDESLLPGAREIEMVRSSVPERTDLPDSQKTDKPPNQQSTLSKF